MQISVTVSMSVLLLKQNAWEQQLMASALSELWRFRSRFEKQPVIMMPLWHWAALSAVEPLTSIMFVTLLPKYDSNRAGFVQADCQWRADCKYP